MKVLVVGGRGVLGQSTVGALKSLPGVQVEVAGRSTVPVRLDLGDPDTFPVLGDWPVVVNTADSLAAPPDAALAWVYKQGGTWIETSSLPETHQRLLRLRSHPFPGRVVLGAGVFTGLSNLVAARAASHTLECHRLDLGVRFSPLSRGGQGMVALMVQLAGTPATWFEAGEHQHGPPLSPGPHLPFEGRSGTPCRHLGWRAPFAEVDLLAASLQIPTIGVHIVPRPRWLGPLFAFTPPGLFRWAPTRALAEAALRLLRMVLLSTVSSPVTLVAVAQGNQRSVTRLHLDDGLAAGGQMIAALCHQFTQALPPPGVHCVDEVTTLPTILETMAQVSPDAPGLQLQVDGSQALPSTPRKDGILG